jgi:hypothetical protein
MKNNFREDEQKVAQKQIWGCRNVKENIQE